MSDSNLVDFAKGIYNKLQPEKRAGKKSDTEWHSKKVEEANESFRKADSKRKVGGAASTKKVTAKKPVRKALPRKLIAKG